MPTALTTNQRLDLARSVYTAIVERSESLEHDDLLGPDLAYLLGGILYDRSCEWPPDRPIVQHLRQAFPPRHPVWTYITLELPEEIAR